jgi:hypothetical protein
LQVNSYSVLLDKLPVDQVPRVASCPCQPPLAVHSLALVVVQVRVELPRLAIVAGEATRVTTGAGRVTITCIDCVPMPPEPEHVSV